MTRQRDHRNFREVEADYFRSHPEEIAAYVEEIFEEYARDNDATALLASLRVLAQVRGVTALAEATGMSRQGIQHALSPKGNPRFENIAAILRALGYRLTPAPIEHA